MRGFKHIRRIWSDCIVSIIQLLANAGPRPSADPDAAYLKAALPLNSWAEFNDQSPIIRGSGSAASVLNYYDSGNPITIQSTEYKFNNYGSAAQKPFGPSDYTESHINVNTGVGTQIGTGDFCIEFWMYTESYTPPSPMTTLGLLYPFWLNNYDAAGYVPSLELTSGGGVRVMNPERTVTIAQTGAIGTNAWHHIAVTRSGSTVRVFVDGNLGATGSTSINFTGYEYWFFDSIRRYNFGFYMQDIRVYVGTAKYTSNFTPPGAMFI